MNPGHITAEAVDGIPSWRFQAGFQNFRWQFWDVQAPYTDAPEGGLLATDYDDLFEPYTTDRGGTHRYPVHYEGTVQADCWDPSSVPHTTPYWAYQCPPPHESCGYIGPHNDLQAPASSHWFSESGYTLPDLPSQWEEPMKQWMLPIRDGVPYADDSTPFATAHSHSTIGTQFAPLAPTSSAVQAFSTSEISWEEDPHCFKEEIREMQNRTARMPETRPDYHTIGCHFLTLAQLMPSSGSLSSVWGTCTCGKIGNTFQQRYKFIQCDGKGKEVVSGIMISLASRS